MNGFGHLYMWVFFVMAIVAIALILLSEMVMHFIREYLKNKNDQHDEKDYDDYDNE